MKRTILTAAAICAVLMIGATTYGQIDNDYRTKNADITTWGNAAHWERYETTGTPGWINATYYPGESGGPTPETVNVRHATTVAVSDAAATVLDVDASLTINNGGTVAVATSADIDAAVTVNTGGTLNVTGSVALDATLTVAGGDVDVGGNIDATGAIAISSSGTLDVVGYVSTSGTITITSGSMGVGTYLSSSAAISVTGTLTVGTYLANSAAVTINSGGTVTAAYLDVDENITINSGGLMTINGSGDTSDIASGKYIRIATVGVASYADLQFSVNHTVQGDGSIDGVSDYARVRVADTMTLTSQVKICGILSIDEVTGTNPATLDNQGEVHADDAGVLNVAIGTIRDSTGDRWKTSGSDNAVLRISDDATGSNKLVGNIILGADASPPYHGTLDIQADVTSSGTLDQRAGTVIQVASGMTLQIS